jgi:hypothetical protein
MTLLYQLALVSHLCLQLHPRLPLLVAQPLQTIEATGQLAMPELEASKIEITTQLRFVRAVVIKLWLLPQPLLLGHCVA